MLKGQYHGLGNEVINGRVRWQLWLVGAPFEAKRRQLQMIEC